MSSLPPPVDGGASEASKPLKLNRGSLLRDPFIPPPSRLVSGLSLSSVLGVPRESSDMAVAIAAEGSLEDGEQKTRYPAQFQISDVNHTKVCALLEQAAINARPRDKEMVPTRCTL